MRTFFRSLMMTFSGIFFLLLLPLTSPALRLFADSSKIICESVMVPSVSLPQRIESYPLVESMKDVAASQTEPYSAVFPLRGNTTHTKWRRSPSDGQKWFVILPIQHCWLPGIPLQRVPLAASSDSSHLNAD